MGTQLGTIPANQDMSLLTGDATGTPAGAGQVGELVLATLGSGSAVSLTTATSKTVTSVALTAGDWDVEGMVVLSYAAATQSGDGQAGISGVNNTLPVDGLICFNNTRQTTTTSKVTITVPLFAWISSGSQTIYLVAQANFSAGTCTAYGNITARRRR